MPLKPIFCTTLLACLLVGQHSHATTPAKPAAAKQAAGKSASGKATPAKAKTAAPKPLPPATEAQISAVALLHLGRMPCELGAQVLVSLDAKHPGYVDILFGKQLFKALTTLSRTGALRVEDDTKGVLWLQLGNKSMLMDVKRGQRLADDCVHVEHTKALEAAKGKPVEALLDARPVVATAAASSAASSAVSALASSAASAPASSAAASAPASSAATSAAATASAAAPTASR